MRTETEAKINSLHNEIANLISLEKDYYNKQKLDKHWIIRYHANIDSYSLPLRTRELMKFAPASLPR